MKDDPCEVLSNAQDKTVSGLPREGARRASGAPPRPPALWTARPMFDAEGIWGAYPKGFVAWAARALQSPPDWILHVCSGGLRPGQGVRVDIRTSQKPDVVADGKRLPFPDGCFRAVMIDPPYTVEYARDLYGTEYPRPSHLLREASRVVWPGGRVGMLHFLVPMSKAPLKLERVYGVTTGAGYRIRAFSVFVKDQDSLPLGDVSEEKRQ